MYKIMIIDDETSIRNLLKIKISWTNLDVEVVGEAASGVEAINIIDDLKPHIVFVDIRMPFMNGIEFAKLAIERYPKLKIIILTAFDEFEYARECIRIGVKDYLLKPVAQTDIQTILEKIKSELDHEVEEKMMDEDVKDECIGHEVIHQIKQYILAHYMDPDLNLTSTAMHFGFNPSYLSRIFKAEVGDSFIDFLTECRMEKAKQLARREVMMYCAAKEVGIPDSNYFGKCFKKYTGKAYSLYMKE